MSAFEGWDVRGGHVWTAECQVCGSPVTEFDERDPEHDDYINPFATRTMTLSPCGLTDLDAPNTCLAWGTRHNYECLGAVMWWAHLWAEYWGGSHDQYPPRLASVLAETGIVTLLDADGRPVDRIASASYVGDRLLRPAPVDVTVGAYSVDAPPADVMSPHEEYRREPGGIYRRTR